MNTRPIVEPAPPVAGETTPPARLHYLYDPLCGWCYGAAPLLDALARRRPALPVTLHGGGLFQWHRITPDLVAHIREHDARIQRLSGQPFGPAYRQGLLEADDVQLDSASAIAAILAVERLDPALARPMLQAIQDAHYQQGLRVVERATLAGLATALGLAAAEFDRALEAVAGEPTRQHIATTRALMARAGARGFPTFALQQGERLAVVDHVPHYGRPEAFVEALTARLA